MLTLLLFLAVASSPVVHLSGPSGDKQLTATQIAALPRTTVTISDHGTNATFEGTELANLLTMVGVPAGEKLRGKELTGYVMIEAADGYHALFALPEADPAFAERKIILADKRDGKPLSEKEGPFRIVVEREKRQARCVRQVTRIVVGHAR
jgi:hypothetical protein